MAVNCASTQLAGITNLTVLATVKDGFVEGFEATSHVNRLQMVLRTLNAIRLGAREASTLPNPFPDPVGRFDIAHFFRFTVVPADTPTGRSKLLLNVTFDGGWEPYMRVIWRDLGTLLDLMFCHCEGYPLSTDNSCEAYMRWVRAHEIQGGFFYADSAMTVVDQRLLRQIESPPAGPMAALAAMSFADRMAHLPPAHQRAVAEAGLRIIRAFQGLAGYFPSNTTHDEGILRRGMHDVLRDLLAYGLRRLLDPNDPLRVSSERLIGWFERPDSRQVAAAAAAASAAAPALPATLPLDEVQVGILRSHPEATHGALVLLRVDNAQQALDALAHWPVTTEAQARQSSQNGHLQFNVALTMTGLKALGVPADRLDNLPQEFRDGMDARAGILGDLHGNHPDQWRTPFYQGSPAHPVRIALSSVHIVVQLRGQFARPVDDSGDDLPHPDLRHAIARLEKPDTGLKILAVEAMHRHTVGAVAQDHFGFQDGISQPRLAADAAGAPPRTQWTDTVPPGELLLGHDNSRGDRRSPQQPDALLDNGTYLVVRKLAQNVDRLDQVLQAQGQLLQQRHGSAAPDADTLRELMMGRCRNGRPLVDLPTPEADPNDFNYQGDAAGARCPFQSHIRRTNMRPADAQKAAGIPRIARRGMSYGPRDAATAPEKERGLIFMACNASIAEQFEVLQRWVSGGNSSGTLSWQSDPFLGVPEPGTSRTFRFQHQGQAMQIDLGPQPFVELRWGLYLFMPSLTALRSLKRWVRQAAAPTPHAPASAPAAPPPQPPLSLEHTHWKLRLEDRNLRDAAWAEVRKQPGGVLRTGYGVLVGSKQAVMEVFADKEQRYSVSGYGERMRASVGRGYLGVDGDAGHDLQANRINAALEQIREDDAFEETRRIAGAWLDTARQALHPADAPKGLLVDVTELCEQVLAGLCTNWFGLPDPGGRYMLPGGWSPEKRSVPTCPGHFLSASKFIFAPRPSRTVQDYGKEHGRLLRETVADFLRDGSAVQGPLTRQIVEAIRAIDGSDDMVAHTVTGIILGFPPTVYGNLLSVFTQWIGDRSLWDLQVRLRDGPCAEGNRYVRANACLRKPLVEAMMRKPVPDMVWRTARCDHRLGDVDIHEGDRIIVGICSGSQADLQAGQHDIFTVFGGSRTPTPAGSGQPAPMHACPGYGMSMGVILGVFSALLDAGTLRPTASPTQLRLMP